MKQSTHHIGWSDCVFTGQSWMNPLLTPYFGYQWVLNIPDQKIWSIKKLRDKYKNCCKYKELYKLNSFAVVYNNLYVMMKTLRVRKCLVKTPWKCLKSARICKLLKPFMWRISWLKLLPETSNVLPQGSFNVHKPLLKIPPYISKFIDHTSTLG